MKDREGAGLFPHAIDLLKRVDTSAMRDSFNLRASRSKGAHLGFRGTSKKSAVDSRSKGTVLSRIACRIRFSQRTGGVSKDGRPSFPKDPLSGADKAVESVVLLVEILVESLPCGFSGERAHSVTMIEHVMHGCDLTSSCHGMHILQAQTTFVCA